MLAKYQAAFLSAMDEHPRATLAVLVAAPVAILCLWLRSLNLPSMSKIPGPWYLKFTTLFVKYHQFRGSGTLWAYGLHLKYGPVVQIGSNEISFASFTATKQIYNTGNRDFGKTEIYHLFKQEGHINLFTAFDAGKHAEIRKQLADRYSNSTVLKSEILKKITERAETFTAKCVAAGSADVYFYLHAYALDCVTSMLFYPYATNSVDGDKDTEMVRLLSYSTNRSELFLEYYSPFLARLQSWFLPQSIGLEKGGAMIRDYVKETLDAGGHADFTLAAKLLNLPTFDRSLAVSECLDHIAAGIETTGDTLCWLMWELSKPNHQDKVDKLRTELLGRQPDQGLDALPYLVAVVQEALRLWAPGTVQLPRYVPDGGRHMDGYFVPGHTIVGVTSYSMHRLDTSVFPNPEEFLPERWLDPEGNSERMRLFFAFGMGARTCIGKNLAMAEMRACLNAVYSRYRTKPAADMTASMDLDDVVLSTRPRGMCCKLEFVPWEKDSGVKQTV